MSSQGVLHIAYVTIQSVDSSVAGVYYVQFDGNRWLNPATLYSSSYFRSLKPEETNVRLAVSEENGLEMVYAAWDDRPQKRILLSKSTDGGLNWGEPREAIVPESSSGFQAPFNIKISTLKEGLLLMWQVGDPGIRCTEYSQWSSNGGENWDEPINMFDDLTVCPDQSEFISIDANFSVALLSSQGDLSLIAWNGTEWSDLEVQSGLSAISNPATFDTITFGCQKISPYKGTLYAVGCDKGIGGDIWFISRKLDPLETMFPSPSAWNSAKDVLTTPHRISSLTSVANQESSIHVFWVESSTQQVDQVEPKIQYARESDGKWSKPTSVITDLNGTPAHLSLTLDNQQRLLLTWVNEDNGDLLFSWANSNRANIPSEWINPVILPSPSKLNDSPEILVDASGRIVVVYAVPINENRGIYLTQSYDFGETWSSPIQVFNAVLADWESIDKPEITLTGDGSLHLLFHQISMLGSHQTDSLYYSKSTDGGMTWSSLEKVGEHLVRWSEIIGYDQQTVHRVWQEVDKSTAVTFHQISKDGGQTWAAPSKISTTAATAPEPALSIDWNGNLHFTQLVVAENQVFQEWEWVGNRWRPLETRRLNIERHNTPVSIKSGVTPEGRLYALLLFEHSDLKEEFERKLFNISRSLNLTGNAQSPSIALIAIPNATSIPTASADLQLNPTPSSPLANLPDPPSAGKKNVIGVILVLSVASIILVFVFPRKKKPLE